MSVGTAPPKPPRASLTSSWTMDPVMGHLVHFLQTTKDTLLLKNGSNDDFEEEELLDELNQTLKKRQINALVKAYNVILFCNQEQCPCVSNSRELVAEVMEDVRPFALMLEECRELYAILTTPHIQNLMLSHDMVAQRDYVPSIDDLGPVNEDDYDHNDGGYNDNSDTIKIVQLVKSHEPLDDGQTSEPIVGATIRAEEGSGRILIARVMHGGAADRSGLISVGDEVVEVNGISVEGRTPNDVLHILLRITLKQGAESTVTFKLVPTSTRPASRESRVRLRALFDYDPLMDDLIPCKEAGLAFDKGDVLHVINEEDPYWWQARRDQDAQTQAGLVPSQGLQERRIVQERFVLQRLASDPESVEETTVEQLGINSCWAETKSKLMMYDVNESDDFDREFIATYEEVVKVPPMLGNPFRPIVLIGPPGVGRNEIKRRILASNPDRFRSTIPHTSRDPRAGEVDGRDYFFEGRQRMQQDIDQGLYIEHGEFKGNLYGTSIQGVAQLIQSGLQPIITPHFQALKKLRTALLKPFVVYVKAPPLERLKETRHRAFARSTFEESSDRAFTDDEFHAMVRAGERLEYWYGHWFDLTVLNDELPIALEQVTLAIHELDSRPQWMPVEWLVQ